MKKEVIHFVQYVLVKILFFGAAYPLQAQVSNPSSWESFVGSDENRLISDTLRLQTFVPESFFPPSRLIIIQM